VATLELSPVDQAIVDHLATLAWPVGYCDPGAGGGWQGEEGNSPYRPNLQVWPTTAGYSGKLATNHGFTDGEWQIRAVAVTAAKVRQMIDVVHDRMLNVPIAVPAGIAVVKLAPVTTSGPREDNTVVPPLMYANEVFEIQTVPA
jgi:hypothetical protein